AFIANAKLRSLGGHSIQEIETWDDSDEAAAQAIIDGLRQTRPIAGMGDDAQVLAGATLVLLQSPTAYRTVSDQVNVALDASFKNDHTFGFDRRHHIIYRPWSRRAITPRTSIGVPLPAMAGE